jgi:hypothetical protein
MKLPPAPRLPTFTASEAKRSDGARAYPVDVDPDDIPTPLLPPPLSGVQRTARKDPPLAADAVRREDDRDRGSRGDVPRGAAEEATRATTRRRVR